ncbi:MAG TPA: hypothetical protein PKD53_09635 [Chloroflexaceae bacterium]|nr:hypothetical protein [Chloroflexaceae bacterium]
MARSSRRIGAALVGLLAALAVATGALAGGWSVIVLDEASAALSGGGVTAGAPFSVGFTVLQHGRHPVDGLTPRITLTPAGGGEAVTVEAVDAVGPGRYTAEITLPSAGMWEWQIDAFGPPAPMAPLVVAAPAQAPARPVPVALPWLAGVAAVGLAGLLALRLRRGPAAVAP